MRCPNCASENREGAKFCDECAAPLPLYCSACGSENRPGAKFCNECATPLARQSRQSSVQGLASSVQKAPDFGPRTSDTGHRTPGLWTPPHLAEHILAEQAALEARGALNGERKTVTALFADIKGSMELIEDLDLEEARQIIDAALKLMMDAVHRYEGYVVQSTGDGIFALFGAPLAREDHPQRALYAALRMQEDSKRYAEKLRREKGLNLQIRVGLNTGEVIVRSIRRDNLHTDYTPIGHSTSLAARMEQLATPGSILVSEQTQRLAQGYFEFKSLGAAQVKGVSGPVYIYEVLGVGPLRTRLQVSASRGLVRFVGRQNELAQINQALAQARLGHGQIIAVRGEPGVGKSRLFHEFKVTAQRECLVLETFSVSLGKASSYLPLIELLKDYFHITLEDDERKRREKITGKVLTLERAFEDTLPYFFALLGASETGPSLPQVDPQVGRQYTFAAILRLLLRESLNQPLILICEDLHWIDDETQAFLTVFGKKIAAARILLLVNYRPEYQHDWSNQTPTTQLHLAPLGRQDAEEFLTAVLEERVGTAQAAALLPLRQLILDRTEGNPFFMEEIVQALVEERVLLRGRAGATSPVSLPTALHIPPTVQGVLAARIDRLAPEEKSLLQALAVIGKEFSLSLLRQVVEQAEDDLQRLLTRLQRAEFIYQQPALPDVEYTFKHALTQEVAYNSLLLEQRRVLHERTAQVIEALWGQQPEEHYSELAHHYSRSGNIRKAVKYLLRAGEQASRRSANGEAISQLTTALELLKTLPDTPERSQQELILHLALGVPLVVTRGIASPEVGELYNRALELTQQTHEPSQLFPVLQGLWNFYEVRGALQTARELGLQLLDLAQRQQDSSLSLIAHGTLGDTLLWLGEFAAARVHAEQGSALYNLKQHRSLAFLYGGHDLGVSSLLWAALALWHLGYPDQARTTARAALTLAQELSHPYSLAHALSFAALLHQFCGQRQTVQEQVEMALALSREQEFTLFLAMETILHGWGLLEEEPRREEGLAQMCQGLESWQATGAELLRPYYLALQAEAYGQLGLPDEGLGRIAEALAASDKSAERWWEAELYRLKGQLTLQSEVRGPKSEVRGPESEVRSPRSEVPNTQHPAPNTQAEAEAEACFHKAIAIAHRQGTKALELRAVMSLSRLWCSQGKRGEAQQRLAAIYDWFTEGFDTADLQEAKTWLEALRTDGKAVG
ncbi:MAG: AAA family ATPase [Deltaproteobacteria bacterium]|nr:AAA family ATPase [Deltaproteobacteria bacterium]